jgi:hypothetical protein
VFVNVSTSVVQEEHPVWRDVKCITIAGQFVRNRLGRRWKNSILIELIRKWDVMTWIRFRCLRIQSSV